MRRIHLVVFLCLLACCSGVTPTNAQVFDEVYSHWPEDLKINGRIIVNNGLPSFNGIRSVLRRAARGGDVVCLTSGSSDSSPWIDELETAIGEDGSLTVISSSRMPTELLKASLVSSQVVFIESIAGDRDELITLKPSFDQLIARGGTLIVNAPVAELLGKQFVLHPHDVESLKTGEGLNLFPDCMLRCCEQEDDTLQDQLLQIVDLHARTVGISLDSHTALVLTGRKVMCFGEGKATFVLPETDSKRARIESISSRPSGRQPTQRHLIDLTEWRRDAIDRDLDPFPPTQPPVPCVNCGTLLIVGGGGSPRGLMDRFVELAGGPKKAKLVYVPCSENDEVGQQQGMVRSWERMGVQQATFIHTKDRRQANSDEEFLAPLRDATGIFYGGGRQWNFSDSYYGTKAHQLMKGVLERGGVIAGSSAGASIQARYLARATPIGNSRIIAPGYERGGLGFIGGVAIDQHFSQRGRQRDMTQLMSVHPQLLGIGIDEATAIEVQQSVAKVSGRGRVFFYDASLERGPGGPDYVALPAGSSYDLASRRVIVDTRPQAADEANRATDNSATAGEHRNAS